MSNGPRALWRNTLTITGGLTALISILFLLSFLFFDLISHNPSPYIGLFTYLIFPGLLVIGVLLVIIGTAIARARFRRVGGSELPQYYPRIDFNDVTHRRVLAAAAGSMAVSLPVIGLLSYRGYHYTDSNEFCGRVCHEVMEPQYTAHQQSPHAHVNCAECHIGEGASWYVKSKLSGIRQVLAVAADSFPRPIPPAIRELRPATETCGRCHWPARFYGDQLVTIDHFASDEANTHSQVRLLLKTGGSDPTTGPPSGIHWHMALGFQIDYVATDHDLQHIPWVQMTDHGTGRQVIYRADGKHGSEPPEGTRRTVDCMDCHNRPTHVFRSPDDAANTALNVNPSLQSLPFSKRELVAALVEPHASKESGLEAVGGRIKSFYEQTMPEVWKARSSDVQRLIEVGREIYRTNFFPEMKATWRTYPDNIGHMQFAGCFRCHDGKHVDPQGNAIRNDCGVCHEFFVPADGAGSAMVQSTGFVHPVPLEGIHAALRCDQCHTGGAAPPATCDGCHADVVAFRTGTHEAFKRFQIAAEPMAEQVSCDGCHNLAQPRSLAAIDALCMDCHEDEEDKYKGMLAAWNAEIDELMRAAVAASSRSHGGALEALRKAGPLHNPDAAKKILRDLKASATQASNRP